jgi:hypothetical protein
MFKSLSAKTLMGEMSLKIILEIAGESFPYALEISKCLYTYIPSTSCLATLTVVGIVFAHFPKPAFGEI